jgi:hypothetical protein
VTARKITRPLLAGVFLTAACTTLTGTSQAAGDVAFSNSADNRASFDCWSYSGGRWHKINDGDTRWVSRNTPIKCDHRWRLVDFGRIGGTQRANRVYRLGNFDYNFDWVVAVQA